MHVESGEPDPSYIVMPDGPDIQERLQLVSSDPSFHGYVTPRIMELAGVTLRPSEFVESLEVRLSEYAKKTMLGIKALALADIEDYVVSQVDNEEQQKDAFENWAASKADSIGQNGLSEAELRKAQRGYRQPKLPRKQKKKIKQEHEKEERDGGA